jgi:hypothetical protein
MRKLLFILVGLISVSQAQTIQYIGAPTTTVISKGNFRSDSLFYLPKRTKLPTDSGAVRYQISDSSVYYWSGFQWLKLGVNIDTSSMLSPYVRGSGTANYLPKFNASRSIVDSKVYESATNLMFNTATPYFTTSGIGSFDINGSTASVLVLRKADTARGYWSHNGSTMDINNIAEGDIRFYTDAQLRGRFQTDGTFRLNSLTGTGTRSVVADANGVLSASSTPTDLIDTTYISTRAWRQKGDDSLGAIIATKGSGTVTSVATGYGLSGGTITTTGTIIVDSAIVASRLRVGKVVDSLALVKQNVLTNPVTGTGTSGQIAYFNGTSTITGENALFYDATNDRLGVGTNTPSFLLDVSSSSATAYSATASNPFLRVVNINASASTNFSNIQMVTDGNGRGIVNLNALNNASAASADFSIQTRHNATLGERLRVTSVGELLLNTTTDAGDYKLQVSGNAYVTGTTVLAATSGNVGIGTASITGFSNKILHIFDAANSEIHFTNNTTGNTSGDGMVVSQSGNNAYFFNYESGFLGFGTSNTERARFNSAGEFTISPSGADSGNYQLQVTGNAYVTGTAIFAAVTGNVGIGSQNTSPSAKLDVISTTSGFLPPRMTTTQRDAISSPAAGLVIYNTTTSKLQVYTTAWTDLH